MRFKLNHRGDIGSPFAIMGAIILLMALMGIIAAEMMLMDHQEKEIKIIQKTTKSIAQPTLIVALQSTYNGEPFSTTFADYYCQFHKGSAQRQEINSELRQRIELVARKSSQAPYLRVMDCTNHACYNVYTIGKLPKNPEKAATTIISTAEATMSQSCIEHTEYVKIDLIL